MKKREQAKKEYLPNVTDLIETRDTEDRKRFAEMSFDLCDSFIEYFGDADLNIFSACKEEILDFLAQMFGELAERGDQIDFINNFEKNFWKGLTTILTKYSNENSESTEDEMITAEDVEIILESEEYLELESLLFELIDERIGELIKYSDDRDIKHVTESLLDLEGEKIADYINEFTETARSLTIDANHPQKMKLRKSLVHLFNKMMEKLDTEQEVTPDKVALFVFKQLDKLIGKSPDFKEYIDKDMAERLINILYDIIYASSSTEGMTKH